jgi:hypothetical protein
LTVEGGGRRVEVRGIDEVGDRLWLREACFERAINRRLHLFFDFFFDFVNAVFVEDAFPQEKHLQPGYGITLGVALTLAVRAIKTLVVGERMGIWSDNVRVNERGALV